MYYGAHLIAISAAALWVAIKRLKGALLPLLLILACASFEFFVSALGDCKETTRHLFLFRAMMELVLVIAIAGSVHRFSRVDRVLVKNRHA
jgi:predicted RND superfamily exporter protein